MARGPGGLWQPGPGLAGLRRIPRAGLQSGVRLRCDADRNRSALGRFDGSRSAATGCRCQERDIKLAILAVPAAAAQEVTDRLVEVGISGILNFAPVTLVVPDAVTIAEVDLAIQLEQLSFAVVKQLDKP